MVKTKARIGLIGLGYVGRYVYQQISSRPELGLEVAFVHDLAAERLADVPAKVVLPDITAFVSRRPDLVVEMAHPAVTRQFGELFPRNVNSHATVALAGIGFERTRLVLVADPSLDVSVIELAARGQGVAMKVERTNPLKGVSGVFTLHSTLAAITRAKGSGGAMQIC